MAAGCKYFPHFSGDRRHLEESRIWNDYFTPLIYVNDSRKYTLPLGLASMKGMYSTDWPVLMASSVISVLPVLIAFLFAQDAFVKGVMMTGMKE